MFGQHGESFPSAPHYSLCTKLTVSFQVFGHTCTSAFSVGRGVDAITDTAVGADAITDMAVGADLEKHKIIRKLPFLPISIALTSLTARQARHSDKQCHRLPLGMHASLQRRPWCRCHYRYRGRR